MIEFKYTGDELYARMERGVKRVNERLRKTVRILESAKIPYAVVGGYAVRGSHKLMRRPYERRVMSTSWFGQLIYRW